MVVEQPVRRKQLRPLGMQADGLERVGGHPGPDSGLSGRQRERLVELAHLCSDTEQGPGLVVRRDDRAVGDLVAADQSTTDGRVLEAVQPSVLAAGFQLGGQSWTTRSVLT